MSVTQKFNIIKIYCLTLKPLINKVLNLSLEKLKYSLKEFKLDKDQRYIDRLHHEYSIITNMGFEDYF